MHPRVTTGTAGSDAGKGWSSGGPPRGAPLQHTAVNSQAWTLDSEDGEGKGTSDARNENRLGRRDCCQYVQDLKYGGNRRFLSHGKKQQSEGGIGEIARALRKTFEAGGSSQAYCWLRKVAEQEGKLLLTSYAWLRREN